MKPSISIDLPGWCTLRKESNEAGSNELLLGETVGSASLQDFDSRSSSSTGNASGYASGIGNDDSDDDDAIARLFSIGELKRRKSSDSHQQTRSRASSGRAGRGSAGFDLQAEAYLDWPCVRCTFINAYAEEACGGCGGSNKKRERLLRERRVAAEQLWRLQSARESRDRSLKEEAFKDVLEDSSDSDGEGGHTPARESSAKQPASPTVQEAQMAAAAGASTASVDPFTSASSSQDTGQSGGQVQPPPECGACVINMLPPDLLLQCAEYMGDTQTLCRVREVCLGWVVALDDRDAGRRLWRPLFYRLRASGSIHKATDATGQQHRQLKVYDLGAAHAATASSPQQPNRGTTAAAVAAAAAAPALGSASTTGMLSTPSPSHQRRRPSSLSGRPPPTSSGKSASSWSGKRRPGPKSSAEASSEAAAKYSYSPSTIGASRPREASACVVCGLIQREGYSGRDCEMCASALVLVGGGRSPAAAATPRLAYTRVNLSGAGGAPPSSCFSPHNCQQQRKLVAGSAFSPSGSSSLQRKKLDYDCSSSGRGATHFPSSSSSSSSSSAAGVGSNDVSTDAHDREEQELGGGARSTDWHFLVKRLAEEKRIAAGWGSLHHGWVWLQRSLQNMLRRRRGDTLLGVARAETTPAAAAVSGRAGGGGDASQGELDPTIARLVGKLANKKWVLLYDSLKATFTLQAEGLAREVVFEAMAAAADAAAQDVALGEGGVGAGAEADVQHERRRATAAELKGLRGCIAAWEAYKDWCEEVDMYCEILNEQISAERYRTAGAGCGRGDNTPYIRDTALLSFRHSFALNVQICAILRASISDGMPIVNAWLASDSGPRRKVARCEVGNTVSSSRGAAGFSNREVAQLDVGQATAGAAASSTGNNAEEFFTDLELMEDSRAIDFSVRTLSGSGRTGGGGGGGGGGGSSTARNCGSEGPSRGSTGVCGSGGGSSTRSRELSVASNRFSSRRSRAGNYYDWFLSKLEGKEAGIIRGDVDARGKSVEGGGGGGVGGAVGEGAGDGAGGGGLQTAPLSELLEMVHDMVEELDVPDDGLSKDRHTQGAMRRLLFLPIKRWQAAATAAAAAAEANDNTEGDPRNLLMAGLSPAPGKEGFHRLRGGAAGRRKGTPPMSSLGKDAGKSWEHLRTLFG